MFFICMNLNIVFKFIISDFLMAKESFKIWRVVCESFWSVVAVKCRFVWLCVDLPTIYYPLCQVGVADIVLTETYHVAISSSDLFQTCYFIKRVVSYDDSFEKGSKSLTDIFNLFFGGDPVVIDLAVRLCRFSDLSKACSFFWEFCKQITKSF